MKLFLRYAACIIVALCAMQTCLAQQDTIYYNEKWVKTDRLHANYYRFVKFTDDKFIVEDHFLDGNLQMKGTYTSLDTPEIKYREGLFTYYYRSGKPESDGNCINGKESGMWTYFNASNEKANFQVNYKDGVKNGVATYFDTLTQNVRAEGQFTNDTQSGKWVFYDRKGKITQQCLYSNVDGDIAVTTTFYNNEGKKTSEGNVLNNKRTGVWKLYDTETGMVTYEMYFINDLLDGELKGYYSSGKLRRKETYTFGKMTSGTCYNENGDEIKYFPAQKRPEPQTDIDTYLRNNLKYPTKARKQNVQGRVIVRFLVNEDGTISNVEVLQGLGAGCNEEAVRVIKLMPAFTAGTEEGKPIKTFFTLPINFRLTDQL